MPAAASATSPGLGDVPPSKAGLCAVTGLGRRWTPNCAATDGPGSQPMQPRAGAGLSTGKATRGDPSRLAATTGDRGPGPCPVGGDREAPVVAAAVGRGCHDVLAWVGGVDVPGRVDHRRRDHVHRHGPAVRAGDRDVEVVPVAADRACRQRGRAAAGAAVTAATATATGRAVADGEVGATTAAIPGLGREDLVV